MFFIEVSGIKTCVFYVFAQLLINTNFITIERFELPKVTKSYQKLRIISYRLNKNRMFRVSKPFVNTLFFIRSITYDS